MKAPRTKTFNGYEVVEASDSYVCPLHGTIPVPAFWVGDLVASHTHVVVDRTGRRKTDKHSA